MPPSCRPCGTWTLLAQDVNSLKVPDWFHAFQVDSFQYANNGSILYQKYCVVFALYSCGAASLNSSIDLLDVNCAVLFLLQASWQAVTFWGCSTATWTSASPSPRRRRARRSAGKRNQDRVQVRRWTPRVDATSRDHLVRLWRRMAHYEGGAVCSQARSLWRLEPLRIRWPPGGARVECGDV